MASRRFFTYDPYDYYYASPYHHYAHPYYHQYQKPAPAPSRGAGGFFDFPAAAPEPVSAAPRPRVESSRPVSIPVHFVGSDPEPERVTPPPPPPPRRRAPSAEEAAVRVQAAARGFLARRSVRAVREVEREAEEIQKKVEREAEELRRGDARARIAVGEALMRLLLRLDAVRGAREYRRRVTKRVLALQDAVDALEPKPTPAPAPEKAVAEDDESEVTAEMADESAVASKLPDAAAEEEIEGNAVDETAAAAAEMELDAERGDGEPDEANLDGDRPEGSDPAGEWEMVTEEEPQSAAEPAGTEIREAETGAGAGAGAGDGGVDTRKVMEMVAALCERSAQQCAVIGALAERVDALERAVRRAEDAERRRRRAKKLRKEKDGKGSNHSKCYSD